ASKKASNKRQRGGQKSSSNVFSMFEQSQIQEFKEAFGCIDQDRDGVIKKQDLKETYAQLKLNVKDEELEEMLNEGKGPINFTVFLSLFGEKLNTDPEDTILAAFKLFDPNGTGFVNKDFRRLLMNQADKFTAEEVCGRIRPLRSLPSIRPATSTTSHSATPSHMEMRRKNP
uniref:EF-hand domain-containing protein n=1 Tax=Mola mola TaxID=94237 RepID=A0A3Q3WK63_MOLML